MHFRKVLLFLFVFLTSLISWNVQAVPKLLTYQGRILKADTTPLTYNNVSFEFNIVADNDPACVLYKEIVTGVDLSLNPGVFDVTFGSVPTFIAGGAFDIHGVFNNSLALTCQNASAYNPTAISSRKLKVLFYDGTSWQTLSSSMSINTVPFAVAAQVAASADSAKDSLKLGGSLASTYMSKPGAACASGVMGFDGTSLTCTPIATLGVDWTSVINKPATFSPAAHTHVADEITSAAGKYFTYKPNNVACATNELLKYDGTNWVCGTASGSGISALTGDVTASGAGSVAATVANVGGKTAAQVATAVNDINAAAATYVAKAGSTMTGALNMGGQNLTNTAYITMNASATLHLSNNAASPAGLLAADEGKMWYNSTSDKIEYWDGSAVKIVSNGGSADEISSLVTTGIVQRTGPGAFSTITVNAPLTYAANALGITVGTAAATVAAGDDSRIVGALQKSGGAMTGAIVMNAENEVRFADTDSSNYVGFKSAGVVGANRIWTLPAADGTANQVLNTDGAGFLGWATLPSGTGDFKADGTVDMTGALKLSGGTSSLPGLTFAGDPDTGLWNNGTNTIAFTTGGSNRMQLSSVLASYVPITVQNGSTAAVPAFSFGGDSDTGVFNPAANTVAFSTSAAERMRIDSTGKVGVGTASPGALLHVSAVNDDTLLTISNTNSTAARYPGVLVENYMGSTPGANVITMRASRGSSAAKTVLQAGDTVGQFSMRAWDGSAWLRTGQVDFAAEQTHSSGVTSGNIILSTTNTSGVFAEKMRIIADGNVGIGTATPRAALDVNGTILGKPATLNGTAIIDYSNGNIQYTTASCGAASFRNLKDGGSYAFIVQGTSAATACSFTAYSSADTSVALTVHMPPDHGLPTSGKHTVYNMMVAGTEVYVAWTPGY